MKNILNELYVSKEKYAKNFSKFLIKSFKTSALTDDITDIKHVVDIIKKNYNTIFSVYFYLSQLFKYLSKEENLIYYLNRYQYIFWLNAKDKDMFIRFYPNNIGIIIQFYNMKEDYYSNILFIKYNKKVKSDNIILMNALSLLNNNLFKNHKNPVLYLSEEEWIDLGKKNKDKLKYSIFWYFNNRIDNKDINYNKDIFILDYIDFNNIFFIISIALNKENKTDFHLFILAFYKKNGAEYYLCNVTKGIKNATDEIMLLNSEIGYENVKHAIKITFIINLYFDIKFANLYMRIRNGDLNLTNILNEINK